MDPDGRGCGEKLGGVEGAKAIIRIYYVEKEVIFNKRGKLNMSIMSQCLPVFIGNLLISRKF